VTLDDITTLFVAAISAGLMLGMFAAFLGKGRG
jgi:hypothetical protein